MSELATLRLYFIRSWSRIASCCCRISSNSRRFSANSRSRLRSSLVIAFCRDHRPHWSHFRQRQQTLRKKKKSSTNHFSFRDSFLTNRIINAKIISTAITINGTSPSVGITNILLVQWNDDIKSEEKTKNL